MAYNLSAFAGAGAQFFNDSGVPLSGGLLYTYAAGTTTPATTWTSSSGTVANTNPIVLDSGGRTPNEIWVTNGSVYKFILKNSDGVTIGTYDNIPSLNDISTFNNLITVTGTNTLIGTATPPFTGYTAGMTVSFLPAATNTGAVTIDISGLGAKNVYLDSSTALTAGDLTVGKMAVLEYDGTRFQLISSAQSATRTGAVMSYATANPPPGWLAANGSAISRTTYAALFTAIGTAFGSGDGSTTFNVPDLRDKMALGSGNLYALAATGGSKDAIVVSHTHTITDPGHVHTYDQASNTYIQGSIGGTGMTNKSTGNTGSATTGVSVNTAGSSGSGANLPPYLGLLACIKY